MICGKDNYHHKGHPTSPIALPSSPDTNKYCSSPELQSGDFEQVRHNALTGSSQQRGPGMVANPHNSPNGSSSVPTRPINNGVFRCIQSGLEGDAEWSILYGGVRYPKEAAHHINYMELLAAFLVIKAFRKT